MGIRNDVFGLEQIYQLQIEGQWPTKEDVWNIPSPFIKAHPFGYFGGGFLPTTATVDRIDYSSDTSNASPKGPLSSPRYGLAATGNSNFGYFGGGPGPVETVDRIDYSSDTSNASPKGPLSSARYGLAGVSAAANGLPQ